MKTVNTLNRWQAFVWLWRNDPEGRWLWLQAFVKMKNLHEAVEVDLRDFGLSKTG